MLANKAFFSFGFDSLFKIDLKVNISPKTLAVSATVKGVDELKCPCFFAAKYWCTPWPNSWAKVATSLALPWKLIKIYGWTLGTVDAEKAPGDFPFWTGAWIQDSSKNFFTIFPIDGLKSKYASVTIFLASSQLYIFLLWKGKGAFLSQYLREFFPNQLAFNL